jgi:hypothetical protein
MPDANKQAAPRPVASVMPAVGAGGAAPASTSALPVRLLCPECRAPTADLEAHLRQVHKVYQFRGSTRSHDETIALLLNAVLSPRPDAEAWKTLSAMAREDHGARADVFLATLVGQGLGRLAVERRNQVAQALGWMIVTTDAVRLIAVLACNAEPSSRHLALAAMAQLSPPLPSDLHQPLRGLLVDRRLPAELQVAATAVLIRGAGMESTLAVEFLEKLSSGLGKVESINRLRQLEEILGPSAAIDGLCSMLEDGVRMSCPRCRSELHRPEMAQHLWQEHRLVLDGRRVRDPWSVVEDWLDTYRARGNPEVLQRCRLLAQQLDGNKGLLQVQRLLAARGVSDPEGHQALIEDARAGHASLCPECYALVPLPLEVPPYFINQYKGRLSSHGYRVEVDERGLRSHLEVALPTGLVLRGPEPRRRWTRRGARVFLVGPLVLLSLAVAVDLVSLDLPLLVSVLLILAATVGMELLVRRAWRPRVPVVQRVCTYAWTLLAPRLHSESFCLEDSALLAGLAKVSTTQGFSPLRAKLLPDLAQRTEAAVIKRQAPVEHLVALRRLQAEDAARAGNDPVVPLARSLGRCFTGQIPLGYAQAMLEGWKSDLWTRGNLVRLRVLLCHAAFEAGFEISTLLEAVRTAPALNQVLETDKPEPLAALRLLWSLRGTKPWEQWGGKTRTVFGIAVDARGTRLLSRYPDLLLSQEESDWPALSTESGPPEPIRILLCARGLYLQEVLFSTDPPIVDVVNRPGLSEVTYVPHRFHARARLDAFVARMEHWRRFTFHDFLPQLPAVRSWEPGEPDARLRAWGALPCPQCRQPLVPRVGEVAKSLKAPASGGC